MAAINYGAAHHDTLMHADGVANAPLSRPD
jgi:hypothetical protein